MNPASPETILRQLNQSHADIRLSMVVTPDGLVLAWAGDSDDPDLSGALYIELQLACRRILSELGCGLEEEVFVRSRDGCLCLRPLGEKGLLACLAQAQTSDTRLRMLTWKAASRLQPVL